jgi:hypothetical protein
VEGLVRTGQKERDLIFSTPMRKALEVLLGLMKQEHTKPSMRNFQLFLEMSVEEKNQYFISLPEPQ